MRSSNKSTQLAWFICSLAFSESRTYVISSLFQPDLSQHWRLERQVNSYSFLENRHAVEEAKAICVPQKAFIWLDIPVSTRLFAGRISFVLRKSCERSLGLAVFFYSSFKMNKSEQLRSVTLWHWISSSYARVSSGNQAAWKADHLFAFGSVSALSKPHLEFLIGRWKEFGSTVAWVQIEIPRSSIVECFRQGSIGELMGSLGFVGLGVTEVNLFISSFVLYL